MQMKVARAREILEYRRSGKTIEDVWQYIVFANEAHINLLLRLKAIFCVRRVLERTQKIFRRREGRQTIITHGSMD